MNMHSSLRAAVLAASLCAAAGLAIARSSNMVELGRQSISTTGAAPAGVDAVHKAILAGGARHHWKAIGDQPGLVTLETDSGQHQVVVDVAYDAEGYTIAYKSSANMNYERTEQKLSIHPKYNKWVEELNSSIHGAALDAPAR